MRSLRRSHSYPLLGVLVALGAPVGLLLARAVAAGQVPTPAWVQADVAQLAVTYAYVTVSTAAVLAVLGYLLGRWFDRVKFLSITDALTGLFNRRHFGQRLADEMRRGQRHGHATSVLCVDIDHLKAINDNLGHKAGDLALVAVCRTLMKNVRAIDAVARIGGDEFAVILPETSPAQAAAVSRRILTEIAEHRDAATGDLAVSIGIAQMSATAAMQTDDVLAAADAALYRAKLAGGGRAAMAQPIPIVARSRHLALMKAALLVEDGKRIAPHRGAELHWRMPMTTIDCVVSWKHQSHGGRALDHEKSRADLLCAACHCGDNVRSQDEFGDVGLCDECRDGAGTSVAYAELGGEC